MNQQITTAGDGNCYRVLADYTKLSTDDHYDTADTDLRERYEAKVARCYLDERRPEEAVALSQTWGPDAQMEKLKVEARAAAQLGEEAKLRKLLSRLGSKADTYFLTETPEFGAYAYEDWFLTAAVRHWVSTGQSKVEFLATNLARLQQRRLLKLRVASADEERPTGELALWFGIVHKSRIDRESDTTILIVEGVDIRTELVGIDRKLTALKRDGNAIRPEYDETRYYADMSSPNGRFFVVTYPKASERVASMRQVVAFGAYEGRSDGERWPVMEALAVLERKSEGWK